MLRKEVCENCKVKAAGNGGWVAHSEMLWEGVNVVICPTSVILSFMKKLRVKIRKATTFSAAEKNFLIGKLAPQGEPYQTATPIREKPPIFCPNKRKH
jgi:hypothetical protein